MTMTDDDLLRALLRGVSDERRVREYYAPVASFCRARLDERRRHPVVIGVNGPQGSGKSTLTRHLAAAFGDVGVRTVTLSIDDFYLTHQEQQALARRFPGDPTLEHRGYPGTHDVELGRRTLASLRDGKPTALPAYDKSAYDGRGDRAPTSTWRIAEPPVYLVLLEGWMLGFVPADRCPEALRASNEMLSAYRAWDDELDAFVRLEATSSDDIVSWRIDAERARRAKGERALSDEDAQDYILRFLPAYALYVPGLRARAIGSATLVVRLGEGRHPMERPPLAP